MSSEAAQQNVYDDCSAIPAVKLAYVRRFWATHGQPRSRGHFVGSVPTNALVVTGEIAHYKQTSQD